MKKIRKIRKKACRICTRLEREKRLAESILYGTETGFKDEKDKSIAEAIMLNADKKENRGGEYYRDGRDRCKTIGCGTCL